MRSAAAKFLPVLTVVAAIMVGWGPARADFTQSDDDLLVDWLDLAVEQDPLTEYGVYAIARTGGRNLPVVFVIYSNFKGKMAVLGAFRCDHEFSVQKSSTNGHYDIRCVKQDVFGQKITTILRYDGAGFYTEHDG